MEEAQVLTEQVERISLDRAIQLKELGVQTLLSLYFSSDNVYQYSVAGLKQLSPYTITTGQHNGKWFATTRRLPVLKFKPYDFDTQAEYEEYKRIELEAHIEKHYLFSDTELNATYSLLLKHYKNKVISPLQANLKLLLTFNIADKINQLAFVL